MNSDSIASTNLRKLSALVNPYDKPQEELDRAQVWVDRDDRMLLKSVFPLRGMETFMLAGIYKAICTQLRNEKITSYSPDNARRAQEIITCHLTALCAPRQGHSLNESGGADGVHSTHSHLENLAADPVKTTSRRRGNLGGKHLSRGNKTKNPPNPA